MAPVPSVETRAIDGTVGHSWAWGDWSHFPSQKTRRWTKGGNSHCPENHRTFRTTKRGSGALGHKSPDAAPGAPPAGVRRPAADRGRPLAAKRLGGRPEASVRGAAARARAERSAMGQRALATAQSARTHSDPTAAPRRSPTLSQRPPGSRPAQPAQPAAHPGLPMAPEAGAAPRARCPLPWVLLLLAALLPVVSPAGAPGTRSPGLGCPIPRASSPLLCPPSAHHPPCLSLRGPPSRSVLCVSCH